MLVSTDTTSVSWEPFLVFHNIDVDLLVPLPILSSASSKRTCNRGTSLFANQVSAGPLAFFVTTSNLDNVKDVADYYQEHYGSSQNWVSI